MTLLERLKSGTREHHASIERAVPLMRPDLNMTVYRDYLERLLGYYRPLEEELGRWDGWNTLGIDFAARRKVHLLEQDLVRLNGGQVSGVDVPACPTLPDVSSPARKLGCLYVLEGSTLGSQILVRHVRQVLGLEAETGCAFLAGYGASTGLMWKSFIDALNAYGRREGLEDGAGADAGEGTADGVVEATAQAAVDATAQAAVDATVDAAVEAARETFTTLEAWLSGGLVRGGA